MGSNHRPSASVFLAVLCYNGNQLYDLAVKEDSNIKAMVRYVNQGRSAVDVAGKAIAAATWHKRRTAEENMT